MLYSSNVKSVGKLRCACNKPRKKAKTTRYVWQHGKRYYLKKNGIWMEVKRSDKNGN